LRYNAQLNLQLMVGSPNEQLTHRQIEDYLNLRRKYLQMESKRRHFITHKTTGWLPFLPERRIGFLFKERNKRVHLVTHPLPLVRDKLTPCLPFLYLFFTFCLPRRYLLGKQKVTPGSFDAGNRVMLSPSCLLAWAQISG